MVDGICTYRSSIRSCLAAAATAFSHHEMMLHCQAARMNNIGGWALNPGGYVVQSH
jgi:hypothetical protein